MDQIRYAERDVVTDFRGVEWKGGARVVKRDQWSPSKEGELSIN